MVINEINDKNYQNKVEDVRQLWKVVKRLTDNILDLNEINLITVNTIGHSW